MQKEYGHKNLLTIMLMQEEYQSVFYIVTLINQNCHHSTAVVQGFCKAKVGGSNPSDGIPFGIGDFTNRIGHGFNSRHLHSGGCHGFDGLLRL